MSENRSSENCITQGPGVCMIRVIVITGAKLLAEDVTTEPAESLGGEVINLIKTKRGGVSIFYDGNVSNVVRADMLASNGVIHEIDNVIVAL